MTFLVSIGEAKTQESESEYVGAGESGGWRSNDLESSFYIKRGLGLWAQAK